MSFGIEVVADSSGKFCGNEIRLASKEEAKAYASDLYSRWTLVREWRVVESTDSVNYTFSNERLVAVTKSGETAA